MTVTLSKECGADGWSLTVVAGQTPARGDAGHSGSKDIGGLGQADGGHVGAQSGGAGQLDQGDVIVDGVGVPVGVGEHLGRREDKSVGQQWCLLKAGWTRAGSHPGGFQNLDVLVGAVTLIVLSGDDAVVGPETGSGTSNTAQTSYRSQHSLLLLVPQG